ncbi:cytochrome P450 [Haloarcula mannanilytica]|uniref:Cytochrome P450 n=1 Tax=Haloarcula mannanilytica TaxID=2509225 RepID=A0A4C2EEH2_9EURY|nr:cytochrome P450 [Haloarcula mannanilytica]GCF12876.1 cytochrome P450 [Haloarcula mannanilytica]
MSKTPPGPKGEPLFGSSRTYARDPFRFISALEQAYGNVARFDMGPMDTVMLCDPTAIERVLVSEADQFRKPDFQGDALGDLLGDGLLLSEGETWEQQRSLANPAFSMARLSGMADRITGHAEDRIDDWEHGDVIDAEQSMTRVTLDVILDLMMGVELSEQRVRTIEEQLLPLGQRFEPDPIRFAMPQWMPMPDDAEFNRAVRTLDEVLDDIIEVREDSLGTVEDGPMDFLSVLLRARDEGNQSPEQLRDEMMTMLLAGHDTTALTLTYTWFLLSEHPEVEQRVHEELDAVIGDDRPGMEHVRDLEYLEWVIQEAMRLYPPVYTIFREPTADVTLSGYEVDSGTTLMVPQWGVHRSERFYDDPETFDPGRWTPERASERPRFAYFPFGGGPRHCIGKHLAMLEAQLITATTASQYRLEFQGETPLELLPSLTAHPRQDMSMRVLER